MLPVKVIVVVIVGVTLECIGAEAAITFGIAGVNIPEDKLTPQDCQRAVLAAHNRIRECEGIQQLLSLNATVTAAAQRWADRICASGNFAHDPDRTYGQNIYYQSNNPTANLCEGVKAWYGECKDYGGGGSIGRAGHFTQLVWRSSTKLGVGCCQGRGRGGYYLVANYFPPGNNLNQVANNVPSRPKCNCNVGC